MDNEKTLFLYCAAEFLWFSLIVLFLGEYCLRTSYNALNFVSLVPTVKAYEETKTNGTQWVDNNQALRVYGEGVNPVKELTFKEKVDSYACSDKFNWDCEKVKRIIFCESSYREKIISHTKDTGVMQISHIHGYSVSYLSDYRNNIDVAFNLWRKFGYKPWYSSEKCWSKIK